MSSCDVQWRLYSCMFRSGRGHMPIHMQQGIRQNVVRCRADVSAFRIMELRHNSVVFRYFNLSLSGASVAEWLRRLAFKLLVSLQCGSNPMRGSGQLVTEGCWFTPWNNLFLQLWKLTAIYNQTCLKNGVKHQFTSPSPVTHTHTHTHSLSLSLSRSKVLHVVGKIINMLDLYCLIDRNTYETCQSSVFL